MLLSSAFKATAHQGFLLKGNLKRTKRQARDVAVHVETAEFTQSCFKNESGKVSVLSLQVCPSASLQVCKSASLQSACVAHR